MSLCNREASVVRLSVCLLLLPQTWLDHHQTWTRCSPHGPASRVCTRSRSRSKVMWYGHFCDFTKIACCRRQMTGSPQYLHTIVSIRARIQDVLKVKVKGHVIQTLLWCHEMFAIQYLLTFCLYMHSLYEAPLYSPSSISVRQLHVLSTSWNELLRHWRSGFETLYICIHMHMLKLVQLDVVHWCVFCILSLTNIFV